MSRGSRDGSNREGYTTCKYNVRCLMCMYSRPASAMIAMTSWMDGEFHYLPACRIAIVDLDWDHVKAVDIFAVLR